ncbi:hypothetical protein C2G38_2185803 [Gigaspora rosea]|uniref:Protein kinase domain-containing protein n=1 Tax=Gigaspora rosea TaxID=44941 RepID=A0A397V6D7_9GLOM|nr:hypothetical protein C2G38_2185803 [Gigaspora rosea]
MVNQNIFSSYITDFGLCKPVSQHSYSKGLFGILPYFAPEVLCTNSSLIIEPVRPSLNDLNPAIREFHALTKAGIPKNKLAFIINCVNSNAEKRNT